MASSPAERQLILLSAGTTERRRQQQERAGRLVVDQDWPRLTETLRMRKLLPVLGPRILELAEGSGEGAFAEAVRESIEVGRRQGAFLQLISLRVTAMLAEAGIRSAPLKGPLLGEAIHGDPGRRLSTDIDLLVAPEQLQDAVEVVRGLGYGAPADHVYERGLPLLHYVLLHERGELPSVELHWRVHWYERSFAPERLLAPSVESAEGWQPARVDELAALLLFYARDGFVDLRLASDLSAWWDVYGAEVHSEMMDELLHAYPELVRVIATSVEVAAKTVGLPAGKIISDRHRLGLRGRIAVRLANPNPDSSPAQIYADMGLIDGLLAPRGGFGGFVRRQVLPPSEVLDQHARFSERARQRSMLGRGAGVVARYGLTMTRLLRAPRSLP
jgi:hypothetical protein